MAVDKTEEGAGMDLILWRHADAEDGMPDDGRRLTAKGEKQAERMAAWLTGNLPKEPRILVSPAVRTRQTAEKLGVKFDVSRTFAPGASVAALLGEVGWPDAKGAVLVVGHQPTLGRVAAFLLSGEESDWSMKKGSVWWISNRLRQGEQQTVLRAVMSPEFL